MSFGKDDVASYVQIIYGCLDGGQCCPDGSLQFSKLPTRLTWVLVVTRCAICQYKVS